MVMLQPPSGAGGHRPPRALRQLRRRGGRKSKPQREVGGGCSHHSGVEHYHVLTGMAGSGDAQNNGIDSFEAEPSEAK